MSVKYCFLIPCFEHGAPLRRVLADLERFHAPCIVVDDGSGAETQAQLAAASAELPWLSVHRLPENRGKGAALIAGYEAAASRGFTHVIQLDADGQHDASAVPRLLEAMERQPDALVLGRPRFDGSVPLSRLLGRQLSRWSVWAATRSFAIADPLCGMRGVPLPLALRVIRSAELGRRMQFDPEFAVRCQWAGAPIVNVDVRVVYPEDGLSHFRGMHDSRALSRTYTRLITGIGEPRPKSWYEQRERGTAFAVRVARWIYRTFGLAARPIATWLCAFYFPLSDRVTRAASRDWLAAVWATPEGRAALGRPPTLWTTIRHFHAMASNVYDRLGLWAGDAHRFDFDPSGGALLAELAARRQGAILLGAHLGSFDMLRVMSRKYELTVNVLMYKDNAERLATLFDSFGEGNRIRVISLAPDSPQAAFEIKACLARGEFVGVLADRVRPGGRDQVAEARFLGRRAAFPLSPFLLGTLLGAPMFLALALAKDDGSYYAVCEPLYAGGPVPRRERDAAAAKVLVEFARRLEVHCLARPLQWFNFYPFWEAGERALEGARG
jgi:predicted LPLAT superfamily acyltransferase